MSRMIPQHLVNVIRQQVDISVDLYGINCTLFVPTNAEEVETLDAYETPEDYVHEIYSAKVYIEWSPNIHRLKKLGLFSEDETPMLARFASTAINVNGETIQVEIIPRSYIKVPIEYVPKQMDTNEFELVDVHIEAVHDAVGVKLYKLVPRRVKK